MAINLVIKQLRKDRGLTQEQLSELVGVSLQTVRRWEWGTTTPNSTLLTKLAQVLDTTPEILLEDNPLQNDFTSDSQIQLIPSQSRASQETNTGMVILTLENGRRIEAPATPEGYAFLERLFAMSLAGATPAV